MCTATSNQGREWTNHRGYREFYRTPFLGAHRGSAASGCGFTRACPTASGEGTPGGCPRAGVSADGRFPACGHRVAAKWQSARAVAWVFSPFNRRSCHSPPATAVETARPARTPSDDREAAPAAGGGGGHPRRDVATRAGPRARLRGNQGTRAPTLAGVSKAAANACLSLTFRRGTPPATRVGRVPHRPRACCATPRR